MSLYTMPVSRSRLFITLYFSECNCWRC